MNGFKKRFNILKTANWQFAMLSHLYNGVCPAECHIHICLDFEISYFRNGPASSPLQDKMAYTLCAKFPHGPVMYCVLD